MRALLGFTLAVLTTAASISARAADWYTGVPTDGPLREAAPTVAIDVVGDATTKQGYSAAVIGTIAPFSNLQRSGWRLRVMGLGGSYVYTPSDPLLGQVHGTLVNGSVMAGYEWVWKKTTVAVFGGVEVVNNSISPRDPDNTVQGSRGGLRVGVDFYTLPTDATMLSGVAYYSTNFNGYYGRLKFGMAVAPQLYVGPEVVALGDDFFSQYRLGGHLSGIRFGVLQMGVSAGFMSDKVRGTGLYGILESRMTF